jgi:hypothetical protein
MLLNRKIIKDLRDKLQSTLENFQDQSDFDVSVGNANFNDTEVTFKVNLRLKGAKTQSQKDLEDYAEMYKLDLTKIAKLDGKDFSLSGYRRKARTKPFLIQDLKSGGEYIITTDIAKKYFGKGESA